MLTYCLPLPRCCRTPKPNISIRNFRPGPRSAGGSVSLSSSGPTDTTSLPPFPVAPAEPGAEVPRYSTGGTLLEVVHEVHSLEDPSTDDVSRRSSARYGEEVAVRNP